MDPSAVPTCTMTELRRHLSTCIARAEELGRPLYITRRGKAVAVLMTMEQYETFCQQRDSLNGLRDYRAEYRRHLEEKYL